MFRDISSLRSECQISWLVGLCLVVISVDALVISRLVSVVFLFLRVFVFLIPWYRVFCIISASLAPGSIWAGGREWSILFSACSGSRAPAPASSSAFSLPSMPECPFTY